MTAEEAPLEHVLGEVARRTGLRIRSAETLREQVTVSFSGLPLGKWLRRLLVRVNHVIVEQLFEDAIDLIEGRLEALGAATKHLRTDEVDVVVLNAAPTALTGRILRSLPSHDGWPAYGRFPASPSFDHFPLMRLSKRSASQGARSFSHLYCSSAPLWSLFRIWAVPSP